jgi:transcription termination factor Rho
MPEKQSKDQLEAMSIIELRKLAKEAGLSNITKMKKNELIDALAAGVRPQDKPRRVMAHVESLPANANLDAASKPAAAESRYASMLRPPAAGRPPVRPPSSLNNDAEPARESGSFRQPLKEEISRGRGPHRIERKPAELEHASTHRIERGDVPRQMPAPRSPEAEDAEEQRVESAPSQPMPSVAAELRHQREQQRQQGRRGGRESQSVQSDLDQAYFQKGVLDIVTDSNYGFIRQRAFRLGKDDIYISMSQIKKFSLRTGDLITGYVRPPREGERYPSMVKIEAVNDRPPDDNRKRVVYEELTPVYPDHRLLLESDTNDASTRLIDLFAPVGLGTRGIIVAKPKAGKTIMLKKIANSIAKNHPDVELIAVLIDERPEEVTDFERTIQGEVISSTFDEKPEHHIQVAEMVIEYAKRKVETGRDVVILLDSLTRMARAYNLTCPPSGKTLSGGLDPNSLYKPKSFLGAARNIESGGSLTILATALIETGSRLDDIIFEEFKGTANMELHLSRELADKRIFPAIDVMKSGTRHEELLYNPEEMDVVWRLRKMVADMEEADRMNRLITKLLQTKSNLELLFQVRKATE